MATDLYRKELSLLDTPKIPTRKDETHFKGNDCGSEIVLIRTILI